MLENIYLAKTTNTSVTKHIQNLKYRLLLLLFTKNEIKKDNNRYFEKFVIK